MVSIVLRLLRAFGITRAILDLARTWRGRFILVFVTAQLVIPIHYYVNHRDRHDERFAWRMFSPMRMARCQPTFTLGGQPMQLGTKFHEAWLELAQRGRFTVIEAIGSELCEQNPKAEIRVTLKCSYLAEDPNQDPSLATATYGGYDICTVPRL